MPRVLIVEDDPFTQLLLSNALKRAGYEAVLTEDGSSALKILAQDSRFDVILSDVRMPKMDGFHLLDQLAAHYPAIPVIISSVHTGSAVVDEVLKRGAFFLPRPFTPDQLTHIVHLAATGHTYAST